MAFRRFGRPAAAREPRHARSPRGPARRAANAAGRQLARDEDGDGWKRDGAEQSAPRRAPRLAVRATSDVRHES